MEEHRCRKIRGKGPWLGSFSGTFLTLGTLIIVLTVLWSSASRQSHGGQKTRERVRSLYHLHFRRTVIGLRLSTLNMTDV